MTFLEKFYEWWDEADFVEIIMFSFLAVLTALVLFLLIALFVGIAMGGTQ